MNLKKSPEVEEKSPIIPSRAVPKKQKKKKTKKKIEPKRAVRNPQPRAIPEREDNIRCDQILREATVSDHFATQKLKSTECSPARFLLLCAASKTFSTNEYKLARFIASRAQKITTLGAKYRIQHPLQSSDLAGDYILLTTIAKLQKSRWWVEGKDLINFIRLINFGRIYFNPNFYLDVTVISHWRVTISFYGRHLSRLKF